MIHCRFYAFYGGRIVIIVVFVDRSGPLSCLLMRLLWDKGLLLSGP